MTEQIKAYNSTGSAFMVDIVIIVLLSGITFIGTKSIIAATAMLLVSAAIVFSMSIRVISEWNRMPVLRFGRYQGIIGPGLYAIMPIVDYTPMKLDLRVISVSFRAEKTLTIDNVPVDVEAILFWKVIEPEKAVLNVQMYMDSIQLASQTALRDVIGKNELSQMLAGRDVIGKSIKDLIEERVNNWGIDAISVEIRDVAIPPDLQNAMARVATSEREKDARVILAESESLAADKMLEAAEKYKSNIYAMQLRSLNMMYEISLTGKNLMVFIPTESKGFSIPTPIGMMGMQDLFKNTYKPPEDAAKPKGASPKQSPKKQDIEI